MALDITSAWKFVTVGFTFYLTNAQIIWTPAVPGIPAKLNLNNLIDGLGGAIDAVYVFNPKGTGLPSLDITLSKGAYINGIVNIALNNFVITGYTPLTQVLANISAETFPLDLSISFGP